MLSTNKLRVTITASILSVLTACGGGSGDELNPVDENAAAKAIEPLVGIWNLQDDWNGIPNDEAYLVIKSPDDENIAEATIYDLDDTIPGAERNCFILDGAPGTITQALNDSLFLDVSAFSTAIVALTPNGELEISVYSEAAGTGQPPERVLLAQRLNIAEEAITLCDS